MVRPARVVLASIVMGGAAVAIGACQVLAGIEDRPFVVDASSPAPDVGNDAPTPEEAAPPPDPCEHRGPPPRPQVPFDDTKYTYVMAVRGADFTGNDDAGQPLGFDLDGVCTCDKRPGTAHGGGNGCTPPSGSLSVCDFEGGVDNSIVGPFRALTAFTPNVNGDLLGNQIECGRQSLIIYLAGYNGKADDDTVSVGLIPSWGIQEPHDAGERDADCYFTGSPEERAQPPFPPRWDGTDRWSTVTGSVGRQGSNVVPLAAVDDAYVAGFRLVVPAAPKRKVTLFLAGNPVDIAGPIVVANLVGTDDLGNDVAGGVPGGATHFRISDGVLGGRAPTGAIFTTIGQLKKSQTGTTYFCQDPIYSAAAVSIVCGGRDISSDPLRDFQAQPDGAPFGCDAVSLALRFSASWAGIGDDYVPDASPDADCPDGWGVCP